MYVDYGYYIIRPCRCPEFLKDFSQWILTASSCICDVEPQPFSCMTNDERQKEEYRKRLGLEKREFIDFSEETLRLLGEDRLDTDSRFVFKQDADEIYRRYFSKQKGVDRGYRLIGIALEEAHLPSMEDRIIPKNVASRTAERHFLGFDILGLGYLRFSYIPVQFPSEGTDETVQTETGRIWTLKEFERRSGSFCRRHSEQRRAGGVDTVRGL